MYAQAKPVELCQCYTEGVSLADAHSAADLLWDHYSSEVVYSSDYSCCFHNI